MKYNAVSTRNPRTFSSFQACCRARSFAVRAPLFAFRFPFSIWSFLFFFAVSPTLVSCLADNFTTGIQEYTTQTWSDAIWQPGSASPIAGNTYEVFNGGIIQTPLSSGFLTFPGDSLTLDSDARIVATTASIGTLNFPGVNGNPGLILNRGNLSDARQPGNLTFTIAGWISVVAPSTISHPWGTGGFVITAQLSGSGNLTIFTGAHADPLDIQSQDNSYSGRWVVRSGSLKGSGEGSLGTGDVIVFAGSTFEVNYDIQTPGALTLQGDSSVMILHQDCRFSAVSINGVDLAPGTYTYNSLLAQFPGNFAPGGSGGITVVPAPISFVPPTAPGYYVDYVVGSDSNVGTNPATAWRHCPGDPSATGKAATTSLRPGNTVFFKGGQSYILTASRSPSTLVNAGIAVQGGSASSPIVYDGQTWTGTRANLTDNYSSNAVIAFATLWSGMSNVVIKGFDIGPIGGTNPLPPDTGTELSPKPGWGVWSVGGPASNVSILNCDFHELGYWQNSKPLGPDSFTDGNSPCGVQADGWVNCVISNCTFTRVHTGIELSYIYHSISNLTVANCDIHDYIVWGIDLASSPSSACADYIYIHDNQIHDIGWYYGAGWSGYTDSGGSDQHQDPIFHRIGNGGNVAGCNGTNIDIYNNTFYDSEHYDSVATAYVSLEGGVSANIYNNLFNLPNFNLFIYRNIDDIQASNSLVRVLNNTFIQNTTNANNLVAMSWESQGLNNVWSSLHKVQVLNNVFYDFATNGASSLFSSYFYAWNDLNTATCEASWAINYNLYRSYDSYGFANWYGQSPQQGGLSWMQARGWEANGSAADPLFVSLAFGSTTNAYRNDYHLQSGSPAIGAGINLSGLNLPGLNADRDGTPRPASGPWAIGAYH
jgi:hypothetical protein